MGSKRFGTHAPRRERRSWSLDDRRRAKVWTKPDSRRNPRPRAWTWVPHRPFELDGELLEPGAEGGAEVVALEGELNRGFQEAELVAGVVALALVAETVDLFVLQQGLDAVGELQF